MKSFIVICVALCFVGVFSHHHADHHEHPGLTKEQEAKIHEDVEACITESKVDRQLFEDMSHGREFKPTRELDCFSACIFKKQDTMTADGTIVEKPDDTDKAKECKKEVGKDACETAGKVMGCFYKNGITPQL